MTEWPSARVIRALTSDQQIRLAALDASTLWDGVRRGHPQLDAAACACLTELLSATALLNSRALFLERLQLVIKGAGRATSVVTDCWPNGTLRGVLDLSEKPDGPWIDLPGTLRVIRSTAVAQPWTGTLPLVAGPISTQVETYLRHSEQIQASLTLWCDPLTGQAGGLLAEPLPDCPPQRLNLLVQAIEGLEVLQDHERVPAFLVEWVNGGEGAEILGSVDLFYRCRCTRSGLLGTLLGFPEDQRRDLFEAEPSVEVRCDYCGKTYLMERHEVLPGEEAS
jgi:molecular chaperone Hsp33